MAMEVLRHNNLLPLPSGSKTQTHQPRPSPPLVLPPPASNLIAKHSVPEVYPQVLALLITRRPLFSGYYKAVVLAIRDDDTWSTI
jgi:Lon-like ATP-dependent protease